MSESCPDFRIAGGGGAYLLNPGEADTVIVRFIPTGCGSKDCTIDTGTPVCGDVSCTGTGGGTECGIEPVALNFGSVSIGQSADRTFTITNRGCDNLTGSITESCDEFTLMSGGGPYELH
jgi:hypothetical protein